MALDLNDKTSNANNLTNGNTVADVTSSTPFAASTHVAGFTRASSQYLQFTSASSSHVPTGTNKLTIEAWMYFTTLPSVGLTYAIFTAWYDTTNYYMLRVDNEGGTYKLNMYVSNNVSFDKFSVTITPSTGTWYHYAGAWQGSDKAYELFVNGSSVATGNGVNVAAFAAATSIKSAIGSNNVSPTPSDDFHDGNLDEVRIWNTKRTAANISSNYNVRLAGNESGLIGYWPFEPLTASFIAQRTAPILQAINRAANY